MMCEYFNNLMDFDYSTVRSVVCHETRETINNGFLSKKTGEIFDD